MSALDTKTIDLTDKNITLHLTLRRATMGDDMRRAMLAANALQNPLPDQAEQTVAYLIFPRCVACVSEGSIHWPGHVREDFDVKELTNVEFIALPFELGDAWMEAALELNPGWDLTPLTEQKKDEAQKNA